MVTGFSSFSNARSGNSKQSQWYQHSNTSSSNPTKTTTHYHQHKQAAASARHRCSSVCPACGGRVSWRMPSPVGAPLPSRLPRMAVLHRRRGWALYTGHNGHHPVRTHPFRSTADRLLCSSTAPTSAKPSGHLKPKMPGSRSNTARARAGKRRDGKGRELLGGDRDRDRA